MRRSHFINHQPGGIGEYAGIIADINPEEDDIDSAWPGLLSQVSPFSALFED
jgi:hypothetical protein